MRGRQTNSLSGTSPHGGDRRSALARTRDERDAAQSEVAALSARVAELTDELRAANQRCDEAEHEASRLRVREALLRHEVGRLGAALKGRKA